MCLKDVRFLVSKRGTNNARAGVWRERIRMANKKAWENGVHTQFDGNTAAKAGKKGAAVTNTVKRQYATFRDAFKAMMTDEDRQKIYDALMTKAMSGDVRAAEFLRDTLGEKPVERVEQTVNEITFRIEGVDPAEADEISG